MEGKTEVQGILTKVDMADYVDSADVVIIGGGVSGLSSGFRLAKAGKDVVLVEKGIVGWEASGRNGGGVGDRGTEPRLTALGLESLRLWDNLDQELGYPTEFKRIELLGVALTESAMGAVSESAELRNKQGLECRVLNGDEIRKMVPEISGNVVGGSHVTTYGHANPQRASQAFAWGFQDAGGRLYQHTAVTGITVEHGRVRSVETTAGTIKADVVVSAAGPQTGLIGEMVGLRVPISPARVEILVTVPLEPRLKYRLHGNGLYGGQTLRGNLLFGGGPHEWTDVGLTSEPSKPNTPLVRNIARRLAELLPGLKSTRVLRNWAGIVEQTPDQYPIIDMLDEPEGFVLVTTSAHGFGLSPATGQAVCDLITRGKSRIPIDGLKLDRFDNVPDDWREQVRWQVGAYNT